MLKFKCTQWCLGEFATYLRHVRSLEFTDKPDYSYLRSLYYDVLRRHSWECDWDFDWFALQKVRNCVPLLHIRSCLLLSVVCCLLPVPERLCDRLCLTVCVGVGVRNTQVI